MKAVRLASSLMGRPSLRRMPWYLPLGGIILACIGAAFIWSAHSAPRAGRHLTFAGIGCVAFLALALYDYRHLRSIALPLYAAGLVALAAMPLLARLPVLARLVPLKNYARRWYDLGPFLVQPSEPMKYLLVIALADHFRVRRRKDRLRFLFFPLILTALPMALIVRQPDVGSAMLFLPIFLAMAFMGGVRIRNLVVLVAAGCALMAATWFSEDLGLPSVLRDYQKDRVRAFISPDYDPESPASYSARQAMQATVAGGLTGQGWGLGRLNRLGRIPEAETDFIFPVIAEEWGFLRTAPIVCLYLLLIVLMGRIAAQTGERFGRLLVGGVMALFAVQSLLHMAISLRLAPITGLTLPLVSYGGSSLVCTLGGFGLIASVRMHRSDVFMSDEPAR